MILFHLYYEEDLKIFPVGLIHNYGNHIQYINKTSGKRASLTDTSWLCMSMDDKGFSKLWNLKNYTLSDEARAYILKYHPEELI